ncbi:SpoIID/LytB domain-containing protein [Oceanobacillus longus]|uniref:SpoIID/LytB domain-containing protein n=1 Tax=Oceanobacillus longus TaxID=930120 RepID=A0ABV8GXW8_9BACI
MIKVKLVNFVGYQTLILIELLGEFLLEGRKLKKETYFITVKGNQLLMGNYQRVFYINSIITLDPLDTKTKGILKIGDKLYLGRMTFSEENGYVRPINEVDIENYVKGVVPLEMSNSWGNPSYKGFDALKAQAIAARTYASIFGSSILTDTTRHQVYGGYYPNFMYTNKAVDETIGMILVYGNSPAETYYSSTNGGLMLTVSNSWGNSKDYPYLIKKQDPFSLRVGKHLNWNLTLYKQQVNLQEVDLRKPNKWWNQTHEKDSIITESLKSKIRASGSEIKIVTVDSINFDVAKYANKNEILQGQMEIHYLEKNTTGFVMESGKIKQHRIIIKDKLDEFRGLLGYNNLKSLNIENVNSYSSSFNIVGSGFGHGIGLSQWGAYQMSKEELNFINILYFYYEGTTVDHL